MELFNKDFKFEDSYRQLTTLELVDPMTAVINGKYYPINKTPAKSINSNVGLRSLMFSNQLYDHDKSLWETLQNKRKDNESVLEYKDSHFAMIIDDIIVSILDSDKYISKLMSILSDYIKDESLKFFYNYKDDEFQFIVLKDHSSGGKSGYIIRYYLSYNWITVRNVFYIDDNLYVSYDPICDKEIEDDLDIILDKDTLLMTCDLVYDEYISFSNKAMDSKISVEELFSYLKYDFGIKIKYSRIDPLDFLASTEYSTEVSAFVSDVLSYIYDTDMYRYVNSPYLKKSITFTKYSFYDYFKVLTSMYSDNQVNINSLINLISTVAHNKTNFCQIND